MADDLYGPSEVLNLAKLNRKVVIASTAYFETRVVQGSLADGKLGLKEFSEMLEHKVGLFSHHLNRVCGRALG